MKRWIFGLLLAGSLGLNAVLLTYPRSHSDIGAEPAGKSKTPPRGRASAALSERAGGAFQLKWDFNHPADVIAQLRTAGAPKDLLMAVAMSLTRREFMERRLVLIAPHGLQRYSVSGLSPEQLATLKQFSTDRLEEIRRILGPDYTFATLHDDPVTMAKYGDLSDEEMTKVDKIVQDYQGLRFRAGPSGLPQLEREFEADIAQALPPDKTADFLTYNSLIATALQKRLSGMITDDAQYRELLQAATTSSVGATMPRSEEGWMADEQLLSPKIGTENYLKLVDHEQAMFRDVDGILGSEGLSPDQRLALFNQYLQINAALGKAGLGDRTAVASDAYSNFTQNLSADGVQRFNRTSFGRVLQRLKAAN